MIKRKNTYQVAEHVRLYPTAKFRAEKIIALDPGEMYTGVAIWDIAAKKKETFTIVTPNFDEMLKEVLSFLQTAVTDRTYIVCEMTFIQHPSATFVWQIIGVIRYFYRSHLCAVPPTQANKGAFGYGRVKLSQKKKILRAQGWEGLKDNHQVAAATLAEFFVNRFQRNLFE